MVLGNIKKIISFLKKFCMNIIKKGRWIGVRNQGYIRIEAYIILSLS